MCVKVGVSEMSVCIFCVQIKNLFLEKLSWKNCSFSLIHLFTTPLLVSEANTDAVTFCHILYRNFIQILF